MSPLGGPRPTSHLNNMIHLGLTAFIMTLFPGLDGRISINPLLYDLARSAIQKYPDNEQEYQEMLLWLLFLERASIFRHLDDVWLIPKIAQTMQALGLQTLEDAAQAISKFPSVNAVHDITREYHQHYPARDPQL
jgi:hypothetical protein